jgi:CBS-domain-containing membrane protein
MVMSENVYCCFDDASVKEAAQLMAEHQVRRLPVLNHEDQLVGIVALADIARSGVKEAEVLALEQISQPSDRPRR